MPRRGNTTVFRSYLQEAHPSFDAESLLKIMVFNRLCDAGSKLGVLRWLESTHVPGVPADRVTHQRLLRTMDSLAEARDELVGLLARQLKPLFDDELSVVFYDLTTLRAEGSAGDDQDLRQYGRSKDGGIRKQCLLGVVQTADGLPIDHEVFEGNTAETTTLLPTFRKVLKRYPIRGLILVADRGLLSVDNREELLTIRLDDDRSLEFILAVPARRYGAFQELLKPFHEKTCIPTQSTVIGALKWQDQRLVIAHDPVRALVSREARDKKIEALEPLGAQLTNKLDTQDEGKKPPGRKLSDGGATGRFYTAVMDARLSKILKVNLASELFTYEVDEANLEKERLLDGKLLLVTTVTDLSPGEVVARYKALADIERGLRVLKSAIEIVPMYHRLPDRTRSHAMSCFVALILHRVVR